MAEELDVNRVAVEKDSLVGVCMINSECMDMSFNGNTYNKIKEFIARKRLKV